MSQVPEGGWVVIRLMNHPGKKSQDDLRLCMLRTLFFFAGYRIGELKYLSSIKSNSPVSNTGCKKLGEARGPSLTANCSIIAATANHHILGVFHALGRPIIVRSSCELSSLSSLLAGASSEEETRDGGPSSESLLSIVHCDYQKRIRD